MIKYVGHIGLRSLTDGHLGRHLDFYKTLNDARVASVGFIKYNASTTRINKEKNFKIKFQVILGFYRTTYHNQRIDKQRKTRSGAAEYGVRSGCALFKQISPLHFEYNQLKPTVHQPILFEMDASTSSEKSDRAP